MICVICNNYDAVKEKEFCKHCIRRVGTWGRNGTKKMFDFLPFDSVSIDDIYAFVDEYYIGVAGKSERASVLKRSLKILGWKGKIVGRHRKFADYYHRRSSNVSWHKRRAYSEVCELCGSKNELHVHHVVPTKWGGVYYYPEHIKILCKPCHLKIHKRLKEVLTNGLLMEYLYPHMEEIRKLSVSVFD